MNVEIKVDAEKVTVALQGFRAGLADRQQLLTTIGQGQLVSIRRTFAESGSPAGSWPPLSPNTLRWRKYSAGHKLLIDTSLLLNSIGAQVQGDAVVIGTNVRYARVHQYGFDGTQNVKAYSYARRTKSRNRYATETVTNKAGRQQKVNRRVASGVTFVSVGEHTRHIRIPARPFLVFRPEDPDRIRAEAQAFVALRARQAGLETS